MEKKLLSQKEYLKKYLSSGKDKKKKIKKKKPNIGSKTVTIIDDDIDLNSMRPIEDGEFEIFHNTEDGPQIAGIVDERGPVDFSDKKRWKIITDDGYGDVSVTSVPRNERIAEDLRQGQVASSDLVENQLDSDHSPPRRPRKDSDSDESNRKKSSSKKHRRRSSTPNKNASASQDGDFSPPRKIRRDSESPDESSRKKSSSKKDRRRRSTPNKNTAASQDSDFSPPRKTRKDSDSDESSRRKSSSKKRRRRSSTPIKNTSVSQDSDFSPPRRTRKDSDSDLSPPRNLKSQKSKSKYSKERENSSRSSRRDKGGGRSVREQNSASPTNKVNSYNSRRRSDFHRVDRRNGRHDSPDHERGNRLSRKDRAESVTRRKNNSDRNATVSPERRKNNGEKRGHKISRKDEKGSESDLSPPREAKKNRKDLHSESHLAPKKTDNYQMMTAETSGFGQAPILRDRKTGRRRDLAAEARDQAEKDEKRQELEEKYAQWGKGLKQVEDRQQKLDRDTYEMSKPLARYADDADLERELKAQEREGDPMLAYMKRKQIKEGKQEPEKPKYSGPFMPNRFGIRPGYRWDGVDRSNGYEKKWFDAQNARKAVQEEAYKWSTADM